MQSKIIFKTGLTVTPAEVGTRLFLSDNPETVNSTTTTFTNGFATMWSDTVSGRSSVRYRVFAWHYNDTGVPIKFGITVGNAGASAYTIHDLKEAITVGSIGAAGKCAASALVGNTMDTPLPTNSSVSAGGVGIVRQWDVPYKQLVGGILEFTLSNTAPNVAMNFRVRTVIASSTSADLKLNQTPVVNFFTSAPPNPTTHPRGSWDFAAVQSAVTYTAAATGAGWNYYSLSNGNTDDVQTAANSYKIAGAPASQGPSSSNKGHYGLKYNIAVTLKNTSTVAKKTVNIYLAARGTSTYFGAVQWSGDGVTYQTPSLASPSQPAENAAKTDQPAITIASVTLNPGSTISRTITISNAGGAAMPAMLAFQTV